LKKIAVKNTDGEREATQKISKLEQRVDELQKALSDRESGFQTELLELHQILREHKRKQALAEQRLADLFTKLKEGEEQLENKNEKLHRILNKKVEDAASESSSSLNNLIAEKTLLLEEKSAIADQLVKDILKLYEEEPVAPTNATLAVTREQRARTISKEGVTFATPKEEDVDKASVSVQ
jgi:hypothetical protein